MKSEMIYLKVKGFKEDLTNHYIKNDSEKLVIFLPGFGYNNDMPLFYYSTLLFENKGYDILKINYKYNENKDFQSADSEEKKLWMKTDIESSFNQMINNNYKEIIFVCKSIGTIGGIEMIKSKLMPENLKFVWLTPLIHIKEVTDVLVKNPFKSLIILGTNDFCFKKENFELLKNNKNNEFYLIEGANHSLEIENNLKESLTELYNVIKNIEKFV